jgi:hypothetical protein
MTNTDPNAYSTGWDDHPASQAVGMKPKCLVRTCDRDSDNHGYCGAHWLRVCTYGDAREDIPIRPRASKLAPRCQASGCKRTPVALGYCAAHRYRFVKYGSPLAHIPTVVEQLLYQCPATTSPVGQVSCVGRYLRALCSGSVPFRWSEQILTGLGAASRHRSCRRTQGQDYWKPWQKGRSKPNRASHEHQGG